MAANDNLHPEVKITGSKGYFSFEFLKISIEIEAEGVKILKEILDFSIEINFEGKVFQWTLHLLI